VFPTTAAVIPVYNPEPGLEPLCEALCASFPVVVVVDDGSRAALDAFARLPKPVTLLRHDRNRGKGRAIKTALAWLIFCGAYLISGWMAGGTYFRYYPTVKAAAWTPMTVSFMLVYLALVLTPVMLDRKEDRQWKSLRSEI